MSDLGIKITIPGLKQLGVDYHDAAAVQLPNAVREGLRKVAETIADEARQKAPKRSGRFAAAIHDPQPSGALGWRIRGGPAVNPHSRMKSNYWPVVNFGSRKLHQPRHEVLWTTLDAHADDIKKAGQAAIDGLVKELS